MQLVSIALQKESQADKKGNNLTFLMTYENGIIIPHAIL
jgi:hypothetical protein